MTEPEATEILLLLKAAFPRADDGIDERAVSARERLYLSDFATLHYGPMREAALAYIRSGKWYPTIADLRQLYNRGAVPSPAFRPALPPMGYKDLPALVRGPVMQMLECSHKLPDGKPDPACNPKCRHHLAYIEARERGFQDRRVREPGEEG